MHFTSTLLLVAAAVGGASAHPSHRHAHLHDKRTATGSPAIPEVGASLEARGSKKWTKNRRPKSSPTPQASSSSASPAPAAPSSGSSSPGSGNAAFVPFCGGQSATSKRASLSDIGYVGNIGVAGKYGCNVMQVDCAAIDKYDYSAQFKTTGGGKSYSCSPFLKIGPSNNEINGFWHPLSEFTVKDGETVCLAFDADTQGGVACGEGSVPRTSIGQLAGTWLEFDSGSKKNLHHITGERQSGADVSALVAIDYKMNYIGMSVTDPTGKECSWLKSNGQNFAAYVDGMHDLDGVGCKDYEKGMLKVVLGD